MAIWHYPSTTVSQLQSLGDNTMGAHIGIQFTEIGENYLKAKMPVDHRTVQPYGILHGGASAALAETLGSVASALMIDRDQQYCVGLEINANHIRSARSGFVYGTVTPLHLGRSTHVWDIKILDEHDKLVCVSRLTVAILQKNS